MFCCDFISTPGDWPFVGLYIEGQIRSVLDTSDLRSIMCAKLGELLIIKAKFKLQTDKIIGEFFFKELSADLP